MRESRPNRALLMIAALFSCVALAAGWCLATRAVPLALAVAVLGLSLSLGPCLGAYALAATQRKQRMRRLVLLVGGSSIITFSLLASANLDLEGFFLLLFEGVAGAAVGHTLITLFVGPALFGRFLCGWGCWRAMILELLPVGHRRPGRLGVSKYLPLAALGTCIAAAAIGFFVFGHHAGGAPGSPNRASTWALLSGFAVYYVASIGLVLALHDQRAFCKYLCPNSPILRVTSRLSLLKIGSVPSQCNGCGACVRVCPMDIDVKTFAISGRRIGTGECILCQRCVQVCPTGALAASLRLR